MKRITFELTKSEYNLQVLYNLSCLGVAYLWTSTKDKNKKGITVADVDRFRGFLNQEIKMIPRPLNKPSRIIYNNLKSVLAKLDKEEK